jgi:hypothetical protein
MEIDLSRYRRLVQSLAERALDRACDVSAHRPRPGEAVYRLVQMLPTGRALLGKGAAKLDPPPTHADAAFVDGHGHTRPAYRHLAARLHHRATGDTLPVRPDLKPDLAAALWQQAHHAAAGSTDADAIDALLAEGDGPLQPLSPDTPPDQWTYLELVGLHALHAITQADDRPAWRDRLVQVTGFHQQHTQPDYTTYQPWALAAFLSNPETTWFAEQQLHDVESHLAIEGGGGAVLPALLLSDAYASLSMD